MRTTAEETERNNKLIIDTAIEIFSQKSYEAVNMQDIADAAGISRGPLYYRYKTKADLFSAAYCAYMEREVEKYRGIFTQDKNFPDMIREDFEYCTGKLQMEGIANWNAKAVQVDFENLRQKTQSFEKEVYSIKEAAAARAIEKGELRKDADPKHIVNLMFAFAEGLFVMVHYRNFVISQEEIRKSITDMVEFFRQKYGPEDSQD